MGPYIGLTILTASCGTDRSRAGRGKDARGEAARGLSGSKGGDGHGAAERAANGVVAGRGEGASCVGAAAARRL